MLRHFFGAVVAIVASIELSAACATKAASVECASDLDCKGERICSSGECVAPGAAAEGNNAGTDLPPAGNNAGAQDGPGATATVPACGPSTSGCSACIERAARTEGTDCSKLKQRAETDAAWPALEACILEAGGDYRKLNECDKPDELLEYFICMAENCSGCCECAGDCCRPKCDAKQCGDDGCGGSCGTCPQGQSCTSGKCVDAAGACDECLSACSGLPQCCTGEGCICDGACI